MEKMKLKIHNFFYMLTSNLKYKIKHTLIFDIFVFDLERVFEKEIWRR